MTKELDPQEQAFFFLYLEGPHPFNAYQSAIGAGYAETTAKSDSSSWVSLTNCPPHKWHLRDAIHDEIERRFNVEKINSDWVLRRARLLAEFNIKKFIRVQGGDAVYDFSQATDDDWYCIEEYATEQIERKMDGFMVPVDKLKIKTPSKTALLKLIGEHVAVQAFKQQIEHSGQVTNVTMTAEDYKKARAEMLAEDDC